MSKEEKLIFISAFMLQMRQHIEKAVSKMPDEWDGHELRQYIIEEFERERTRLMRDKRSRRYRDFAHERASRNI